MLSSSPWPTAASPVCSCCVSLPSPQPRPLRRRLSRYGDIWTPSWCGILGMDVFVCPKYRRELFFQTAGDFVIPHFGDVAQRKVHAVLSNFVGCFGANEKWTRCFPFLMPHTGRGLRKTSEKVAIVFVGVTGLYQWYKMAQQQQTGVPFFSVFRNSNRQSARRYLAFVGHEAVQTLRVPAVLSSEINYPNSYLLLLQPTGFGLLGCELLYDAVLKL